jgi:hypothetical protein
VHRQAADVAAGEESGEITWLSVAITSRPSAPGSSGAVVALGQEGVVQMAGKQFFDQLGHGPATRTVGHDRCGPV